MDTPAEGSEEDGDEIAIVNSVLEWINTNGPGTYLVRDLGERLSRTRTRISIGMAVRARAMDTWRDNALVLATASLLGHGSMSCTFVLWNHVRNYRGRTAKLMIIDDITIVDPLLVCILLKKQRHMEDPPTLLFFAPTPPEGFPESKPIDVPGCEEGITPNYHTASWNGFASPMVKSAQFT